MSDLDRFFGRVGLNDMLKRAEVAHERRQDLKFADACRQFAEEAQKAADAWQRFSDAWKRRSD
jgi:hypothetical protein